MRYNFMFPNTFMINKILKEQNEFIYEKGIGKIKNKETNKLTLINRSYDINLITGELEIDLRFNLINMLDDYWFTKKAS